MTDLSFLTATQQTLCRLLASVLFAAPRPEDSQMDWPAVLEEARAQSVVIPAFSQCEAYAMDEAERREIQRQVQSLAARSIRSFEQHTAVHRLMADQGIPYCILKGVASAWYYPDRLARQMGDVDFFVARSDFARAAGILEANGFTAEGVGHVHHVGYHKPGVELELHFDAPGVPDGEAGDRVRKLLAHWLEEAQWVEDAPFQFVIPSRFHHALIMLLHMQNHLRSSGMGLRHLCDWAVLIAQYEEFEEECRDKLAYAGLWKFAQLMSLAAVLALGLPRQEWMGPELETAQELLLEVVQGGNFGRKEKGRSGESLFINRRKEEEVSRVHQLFISLNSIVYAHWPWFKRCRAALPLGWAGLAFRRIRKIWRGERSSLRMVRSFQRSGKRKALYDRLELFHRQADNL